MRGGTNFTNKTKTKKPTKDQTMLSRGLLADVHLDDPEPPREVKCNASHLKREV